MMSMRHANPQSPFEASLLRSKVFRLIQQKSFSKGLYKLASGKESNYYLDMKPTMFSPEGADALSRMILDKLQDMKVDYVGGLAEGALPLISIVTMRSYRQNTPLPGFFVRKEIKDHGTMKLVEGLAEGETLEDKSVVILEDVTTSGRSAMIAVKAARDLGARVILVLSIVDREEGATEFYKKAGIPFMALFTASEFMAA